MPEERYEMTPEREAMLDTIAESEGADYDTLYGGDTFSGYEDHPRETVHGDEYTSTAAGRYQILEGTWDAAAGEMNLEDFSPANQDQAAMWLIDEAGQLNNVDNRNIEEAINGLADTWASFPEESGNSAYGQGANELSELKETYRESLSEHEGSETGDEIVEGAKEAVTEMETSDVADSVTESAETVSENVDEAEGISNEIRSAAEDITEAAGEMGEGIAGGVDAAAEGFETGGDVAETAEEISVDAGPADAGSLDERMPDAADDMDADADIENADEYEMEMTDPEGSDR
jgi:muramidase (phage lysozyme)